MNRPGSPTDSAPPGEGQPAAKAATAVPAERLPHVRLGLLGLITIGVYGSWYYSFGVLLDPILQDTGWSEQSVIAVFGISTLVSGAGALGGGWILDSLGSRVTLAVGAAVGMAAFTLAAVGPGFAAFAVGGVIGGGAFGSLGFYHITQTTAARITPWSGPRAIAVLTIWGAFASAVFLPLAAWLVGVAGWRSTLLILTGIASTALALGAAFIATGPTTEHGWTAPRLREAVRLPAARRFVVASGLIGASVSIVLVYQVPLMTAAGLSLGVASFWAGARGVAQLGGRIPLGTILNRIGDRAALQWSFAAIAAGALLLGVAGTPPVAALFALVAGFGVGALSPLTGIRSAALFPAPLLGRAMGLVALVFASAGAVGPVVAALVVERAGSRLWAAPLAAGAAVAAMFVLKRPARGEP